MRYQDDLNKHLSAWKQLHLGITQAGVFRYRGRDVGHEHILPVHQGEANLFDEARAFLPAHPLVSRHRYFHHLNSSQAFAFNLFLPYFDGGPEAAGVLLRALGQEGMLAKWELEDAPDPCEGTNVDALWDSADGVRTFCEVKLSEDHFGKCENDDRHAEKLTSIYSAPLRPHLEPGLLEPVAFFRDYQFYRNVWHMVRAANSRLIFLLPRANTGLWTLLQKLLLGVVPGTRKRITVLAIEDVIEALTAYAGGPAGLRQYACKLKGKYVIKS